MHGPLNQCNEQRLACFNHRHQNLRICFKRSNKISCLDQCQSLSTQMCPGSACLNHYTSTHTCFPHLHRQELGPTIAVDSAGDLVSSSSPSSPSFPPGRRGESVEMHGMIPSSPFAAISSTASEIIKTHKVKAG